MLFGIVLLDRPEAGRYRSRHVPDVLYSIGHYLELDRFRPVHGLAFWKGLARKPA